jgi:hypothetical protein
VLPAQEDTEDHVVEEGEDRVIVAPTLSTPQGLRCPRAAPRLGPRRIPPASRCPRERYEAFRECAHQRLAFVHRADHAQVRKPGVDDRALHQGLRDDSYRLTARVEDGVCHPMRPTLPQP